MKLTLQLGILTGSNLALGMVSQWYVFTLFGPGVETDALFSGMVVPQLVLTVITGSLINVLVPTLAGKKEEELRHDAWAFLFLITGSFSAFAFFLYVTAPWWLSLLLPGFSESALGLTVKLTRIQLVGMVFAAINGVQWAAYHARQRFLWAEFTPFLAAALALALLVIVVPQFGVVGAAWVLTLRMALQTALLLSGVGRPVRPNFRKPVIQEAWRKIKPLLIGATYYKTDTIIDRALLSTGAVGTVSLYYFAQQIYGAALRITSKAICAPLVPTLSRLHKEKNMTEFYSLYVRKLAQLVVLGAVVMLGLFVLGQEVLNVLIGHGNVTADNVRDLWWIMIWLSGSFVGGMLGQISASSFYSIGDTATPTRLGIYTYTIFVPIKLLMFYFFSVAGVALSTSAFALANLFLQLYFFWSIHIRSTSGFRHDQ